MSELHKISILENILSIVGRLVQECKYGENPWQQLAGLYRTSQSKDPLALPNFKPVAGDAPSFNNFVDIDRLLQTVTHIAAVFDVYLNMKQLPIAVGVKHGNPCGAAIATTGDSPATVTMNMITGDKRAIFGGLVMLTFPVNREIADVLVYGEMPQGSRRLLDGVIAPDFTSEAIEILARKGGKCRLIENRALANLTMDSLDLNPRFRYVRGGFLFQPNYTFVPHFGNPTIEHHGECSAASIIDLMIAWAVGSTSNSNTITLVKNNKLIGNGVGQQDRVGCAQLAVRRAIDAGHDTRGAAAYSDSFFPFPDGIEVLGNAGVLTILASRGSVKDAEVVAACKKHSITLITIPDKEGRGFFGH